MEAFISGIHSSSPMLNFCPLTLVLKRVRSLDDGMEGEVSKEDGYSRRRLERPTVCCGVSKLFGFMLSGEHCSRRGEQTSAPMYPSGKSQSPRVKSIESLRSSAEEDLVPRQPRSISRGDGGRGRVPSHALLVSSNDSTAASTYSSGRSYSASLISWLVLIVLFLNTPSVLLVDDGVSHCAGTSD